MSRNLRLRFACKVSSQNQCRVVVKGYLCKARNVALLIAGPSISSGRLTVQENLLHAHVTQLEKEHRRAGQEND